ncbi:M15 family metallopeptidase [Kineococcus radiotolerans]|uniref:Peptidase M15C domain-containing protein n=1 Tax=Kineococcus radiotolerans (strain ATCC BAA-149 / DSM 14245 / SRS30216) TaxID=266940 RepID=A6W8P6_KINRD|nr:M15 family metallopeptidase [Kineococcus radiotolerans]ABS03185.1 hypothetical protein Krad_1699 [Kineococcus radiotolerans SRS30216 = ATCC BAA-149]
MATALDRGWPIRQLAAHELYLVSKPDPTPAERAVGVLTVPGFPIRVHPAVGPLFRGLVADLQVLRARTRRAPLLSAGGYNFRPIRGYEEQWGRTRNPKYLSNHSWGLAVDLNAGANPMGSPVRSDFPRDETYAIAAKWSLSWGREWSRPDPMHFEALLSPEQAHTAVTRLTLPKPAPHQEDDLTPEQAQQLADIHKVLIGEDSVASKVEGEGNGRRMSWREMTEWTNKIATDTLAAVQKLRGA